ncbi:hypothetical protein Tco_0581188 [Tanacetum coccineum]
MQKEEDLKGDDLKHYEAEIVAMNLILISIPNYIYNSVDACTTTQAMWQRVERLMRRTVQNKVDRETRFNNEFDQFIAKPGEALVSVYNHFAQLMNDLERNGIIFPKVTINTKFLNLNASRAKKLGKSHDPLALVAHTGSSYRTTSPYYVIHPSSVVNYDDDYQGDAVQNNSEYPLTCATILLARAITQRDRVNIQSRHSGNDGRNTRRSYVQEEIIDGNNVWNDAGNIQRTLQTTSSRTAAYVQCYNCSEKEQQHDKLELSVVELKRQTVELQKTQSILKRKMSENEDKDHDIVLDLEARAKKNEDVVLKIGNSLQGMFMLRPKPMSFYDSKVKHDLGYTNPYALKKAISQNPKLYDASCFDDSKIHVNVRDPRTFLMILTKSQIKMKKKSQDPIAIEKKQNVWTIDYKKLNAIYEDFVPQKEFSAEQKYFSSSFISSENSSNASSSSSSSETKPTVAPMPSANPIKLELNKMENEFQKLFALLQTNSKRESIFYTSLEEIRVASSVRRPLNRDSPLKNNVLSNTKKSSEKVEVFVRTNKKTYVASKNVVLNKKIVTNVDVRNALKVKDALCVLASFTILRKAKFASVDTTPVVSKTRFSVQTTQSKSFDTTLVVSRTKIAAVVQIILWIVDSGCSKHMTGDRSLLNIFVEKFMGTIRFGNDHFAAITGYGNYVQGNITVCHVYYVEGLGHNLFKGDDLLTRAHESNLYTISISDMAASSSTKSYSRQGCMHNACLFMITGTSLGQESMHTPSKEDLDNLCQMYEEYFKKRSSNVSINSAAQQVHNQEDSPLTSLIIVEEHEAPPIITTSKEQTSLISLNKADGFNQEDSADSDGNTVFVPYDSLKFKEAESSTTALDPSNMHEFHQV